MTSPSIGGSSGTNPLDQDLFQLLQQAAARRAQGQDAEGNPLPAATSSQDTDSAAATGASAVQGHHHRHHHGGMNAGMFQKIESAVAGALQSAKDGGNGQDLDQVIQDAITGVLQGNGTTGTSSAAVTDPTASTGTAPANATAGSDRQAFLQMLQGYGIDPRQFFADFRAAIQKANGGQVATSAINPAYYGTGVDLAG